MISRLILAPVGFFYKLVEALKEGSRDVKNKLDYKNASIESGCCINERSKISQHVHIFENSTINYSKISSFTYIGRNCLIQNASIGKFCSIASDCMIGLGSHPLDMFSTSPIFYRRDNPLKFELIEEEVNIEEYSAIEIGNDVWIGTRAIVLDGVVIGTGAVIAAGSVVTKDIPPYAIVGGVPAKIIKYRFSEEVISGLLGSRWWDLDIEEIISKMSNHKLD